MKTIYSILLILTLTVSSVLGQQKLPKLLVTSNQNESVSIVRQGDIQVDGGIVLGGVRNATWPTGYIVSSTQSVWQIVVSPAEWIWSLGGASPSNTAVVISLFTRNGTRTVPIGVGITSSSTSTMQTRYASAFLKVPANAIGWGSQTGLEVDVFDSVQNSLTNSLNIVIADAVGNSFTTNTLLSGTNNFVGAIYILTNNLPAFSSDGVGVSNYWNIEADLAVWQGKTSGVASVKANWNTIK